MLVVAVVAALAFGGYRAATDGHFRGTRRVRTGAPSGPLASEAAGTTAGGEVVSEPSGAGVLAGTPWADRLGERATLLQFSSAFCAPCRATRRILEDVAGTEPGVTHVEVDAEQHLDVVRRLEILRTPTTLVLGPDGHEIARATGAPTKQQVLAALVAL